MTPESEAQRLTLLACPFCGKSVAKVGRDDRGDWAVTCTVLAKLADDEGCGAQGGPGDTQAEAIAAWNRRQTAS